MLGALLITGAAVAAYATAAGGEDAPRVRYAVAAHELAPGALLSADDVTLVAIDLPVEQAASAFLDPAALEGAVSRGPIAAGAIVTTADVSPLSGVADQPTTSRDVSFSVPRARALLGALEPGDRVDVVSSVDDVTEVLVQRALVIATSAEADRSLVVSDDLVITLALPTGAEALAVAHGAAAGELTVLRSTRATDALPSRFPLAPSGGTTATTATTIVVRPAVGTGTGTAA